MVRDPHGPTLSSWQGGAMRTSATPPSGSGSPAPDSPTAATPGATTEPAATGHAAGTGSAHPPAATDEPTATTGASGLPATARAASTATATPPPARTPSTATSPLSAADLPADLRADLPADLRAEAPFTELSARRLGPVREFFVRRPVVMDVLVMLWFAIPAALTIVVPLLLAEGPYPVTPSSTNNDVTVTFPEPLPLDRDAVVRSVIALVLVALGAVALFFRRRNPVAVLATVTTLGSLAPLLTWSTYGFDLAVALALYAVAASRGGRVTWLSFAASVAALGVAVWLWERVPFLATAEAEVSIVLASTSFRVSSIVLITLGALLAVAIGTSVRGRRQHIADLVDKANAIARDRDQQAQLARAAERSRIAREMHDVVAHSLSVMIALSDGAAAALRKSPERSAVALDELSATGRSALEDMRRVLGVLSEPETPFEPQPDSQDLGCLVDRFRAAGMTVTTQGLHTPLPADTGFQLAVFRIVQESLTNTLRHAPATARADVTIARTDTGIEITVTDRGPGVVVGEAPPGSGKGVIGMRERVGVYGGLVEAGPWQGGWRVRAHLPWPDGVPAAEPRATEPRVTEPRAAATGQERSA